MSEVSNSNAKSSLRIKRTSSHGFRSDVESEQRYTNKSDLSLGVGSKADVRTPAKYGPRHATARSSNLKSTLKCNSEPGLQTENSVGLKPVSKLLISASHSFRGLVEPHLSPLVVSTIRASDHTAADNDSLLIPRELNDHIGRVFSSVLLSDKYCQLRDQFQIAAHNTAASWKTPLTGPDNIPRQTSPDSISRHDDPDQVNGDVSETFPERTIIGSSFECRFPHAINDELEVDWPRGDPGAKESVQLSSGDSECKAVYDTSEKSDDNGSSTLCPSTASSLTVDIDQYNAAYTAGPFPGSTDSLLDQWDLSVDVPDLDCLNGVVSRLKVSESGCWSDGGSGSWHWTDVAIVCECLRALYLAACSDGLTVDLWLLVRRPLQRYLLHEAPSVAELALQIHWCLLTQKHAGSQYFIGQAYLSILQTLALVFTNRSQQVDGLHLSEVDGLHMSGADDLHMSGADDLHASVEDDLHLSGADGFHISGADGLHLSGRDRPHVAEADGLRVIASSEYSSRIALRLMSVISCFQKRIYRLWVRFSSEFIAEVVSNWMNLLSVGVASGDNSWSESGHWAQAPLLRLVAVSDPGADWFLSWMHGQESRACLIEHLRKESGCRLLTLVINTVLHWWKTDGKQNYEDDCGDDCSFPINQQDFRADGSVSVVLEACYSHCLHVLICICRYDNSLTLLFPIRLATGGPAMSAVAFIDAAVRHLFSRSAAISERLLSAVACCDALKTVCCSSVVLSTIAEKLLASADSDAPDVVCLRGLYFLVRLLLLLSTTHSLECCTSELTLNLRCCKNVSNMAVAIMLSAISAVNNFHVDERCLTAYCELMVNVSRHYVIVDSILCHPTLVSSIEAMFDSGSLTDRTLVERRRHYLAPWLASLSLHPSLETHSLLMRSVPVIVRWLERNLKRRCFPIDRLFIDLFPYTVGLAGCTVLTADGREVALYQLVWQCFCSLPVIVHQPAMRSSQRSWSDLCLHWLQGVVLLSYDDNGTARSRFPAAGKATLSASSPIAAITVNAARSVECSVFSAVSESMCCWQRLLLVMVSQHDKLLEQNRTAEFPVACWNVSSRCQQWTLISLFTVASSSLNCRVFISASANSTRPTLTPSEPNIGADWSVLNDGFSSCQCGQCSWLRLRIGQVLGTCDSGAYDRIQPTLVSSAGGGTEPRLAATSSPRRSGLSAIVHGRCSGCTCARAAGGRNQNGSAHQHHFTSCLLRLQRFVSEQSCAFDPGGEHASCSALLRAMFTAERRVVCSRCGNWYLPSPASSSSSSRKGGLLIQHSSRSQQPLFRRKQKQLKLAQDQLQLILRQLLMLRVRATRTCQLTPPCPGAKLHDRCSVRSRNTCVTPIDDTVASMVLRYAYDNDCFKAVDEDKRDNSSASLFRRRAAFVTLLRHTRSRLRCQNSTHVPWLAAILFLLYDGDWHQCRLVIAHLLQRKQPAALCLALCPRVGACDSDGGTSSLNTLISWVARLVEWELRAVNSMLRSSGIPVGCVCRSWILQAFLGTLSWQETVRYLALVSVFGSDYAVYFSLSVLKHMRPALGGVHRQRFPFYAVAGLCLHEFRSVLHFRFMERLSTKYRQSILADLNACGVVE